MNHSMNEKNTSPELANKQAGKEVSPPPEVKNVNDTRQPADAQGDIKAAGSVDRNSQSNGQQSSKRVEEVKDNHSAQTTQSANLETARNLVIRAKEGLFFMDYCSQSLNDLTPLMRDCSLALFTPDGKYLIAANPESLVMFDASQSEIKGIIKLQSIQLGVLSAGGKYIQIWNRPDKEWHNIHIIDLASFTIVLQLF